MLALKLLHTSKPLLQLFPAGGRSLLKFSDQIEKNKQNLEPQTPKKTVPSSAGIDAEGPMDESAEEDYYNEKMLTVDSEISTKDLDGRNISPIDINPWVADKPLNPDDIAPVAAPEEKEIISQVPEPPPPAARSGVYEFKGLKICVPKSWMRPETYRYRLDGEDPEKVPDDTRILNFDGKW